MLLLEKYQLRFNLDLAVPHVVAPCTVTIRLRHRSVCHRGRCCGSMNHCPCGPARRYIVETISVAVAMPIAAMTPRTVAIAIAVPVTTVMLPASRWHAGATPALFVPFVPARRTAIVAIMIVVAMLAISRLMEIPVVLVAVPVIVPIPGECACAERK